MTMDKIVGKGNTHKIKKHTQHVTITLFNFCVVHVPRPFQKADIVVVFSMAVLLLLALACFGRSIWPSSLPSRKSVRRNAVWTYK